MVGDIPSWRIDADLGSGGRPFHHISGFLVNTSNTPLLIIKTMRELRGGTAVDT